MPNWNDIDQDEKAGLGVELRRLYDLALIEVIDAIRRQLDAGRTPQPLSLPQVSYRENGMPWISDSFYGTRNGPLGY